MRLQSERRILYCVVCVCVCVFACIYVHFRVFCRSALGLCWASTHVCFHFHLLSCKTPIGSYEGFFFRLSTSCSYGYMLLFDTAAISGIICPKLFRPLSLQHLKIPINKSVQRCLNYVCVCATASRPNKNLDKSYCVAFTFNSHMLLLFVRRQAYIVLRMYEDKSDISVHSFCVYSMMVFDINLLFVHTIYSSVTCNC